MQTYINFGFRFSASLEYKGSDQISEAKTPFLGLQQIFKKLDEVNYPKFGMDVLNKRLLKIECVKGPLTTMYKLFRKFQTGGWFSLQSTTKMFPQPNTFTGVEKIMVQVLHFERSRYTSRKSKTVLEMSGMHLNLFERLEVTFINLKVIFWIHMI